ncbi:MAG: 16S rRNA pseudouridine(516) synthase [Lachnospiraceae bacterium]|nr:16S rRNA pseudouridine(516) synthase [Lachnospiraceae bacterium]
MIQKKQIRLDKYLSDCTSFTRSQIKADIKKGQVTVNDIICKDPGYKITPEVDVICHKVQRLNYQKYHYYMLNKPAGILSATEDSEQKTVLDLFPADIRKGLFPVGRLDKDTVGLLLITDDGELSHRLLSPKKHVEKTYLVHTAEALCDEDAAAFARGITLKDGTPLKSAVLKIDQNDPHIAHITITEGKYHQIKRMIASRGNKVIYLKRISMGSLTLDETLPEGAFRMLNEQEIICLMNNYNP